MLQHRSAVDTAAYCIALVGPLAVCTAFLATHSHLPEAEDLDIAAVDVEDEAAIIPMVDPVAEAPEQEVVEDEEAETAPLVTALGLEFGLMTKDGLLLNNDAPKAWSKGKIDRPVAGGEIPNFFRIELPADIDALPSETRALLGTTVDLYGARGKVCEATVAGFRVIAEHNGDGYDLTDGLEIDGEAWTVDARNGRRILRRLWNQEARWLTATLDFDEASCDGAVFGHSSNQPAPAMLTASKLGWKSVSSATRAAFRKYTSADLEEFFDEYVTGGAVPQWSSFGAMYKDTVEYSVFVDGSEKPVVVRAVAGDTISTCGDGFGGYSIRYYPLADGHDAPQHGPLEPVAFVDIDSDGRFEIIGRNDEGITLWSSEGKPIQDAFRPFMGCPC